MAHGEYNIDTIELNTTRKMKTKYKSRKLSDEHFSIPLYRDFDTFNKQNYSIQQMKTILKHYTLKVSGNKAQLKQRIYLFLNHSHYATRIQGVWRGFLERNFYSLHGLGMSELSESVNDTDFYSFEKIRNIPYHRLIIIYDKDKMYCFDVVSLFEYLIKSKLRTDRSTRGTPSNNFRSTIRTGRPRLSSPHDGSFSYMKNPYTNILFDDEDAIALRIDNFLKYAKLLKYDVQFESDEPASQITSSPQHDVRSRAITLFCNIDSLGNYTSSDWFLTLPMQSLVRFIRELHDIWNYRAQIEQSVKVSICPPDGNPFLTSRRNALALIHLNQNQDSIYLQNTALGIMESMVNNGLEEEHQSLGTLYVLGALTIVSVDAAASLPWLYQSFALNP